MSLLNGCRGGAKSVGPSGFQCLNGCKDWSQFAFPYLNCTLKVARQWTSGLNSTISCLSSLFM
jgi:hypothetical protein